ncbi:alpha/beta hydrolase [Flexivirga sp. ID2601S]|uniref:Alpha/beta hydrolase n=1 Tax=Flexivirga aerilata TaxID=1656889 RepID=A0A849AIM4_9MICO|nr:alpha/beta hydrolase [Flexivirga aerilata]NNG38270.1 alpha/beta hydrolase [Flexivirga aerilata]
MDGSATEEFAPVIRSVISHPADAVARERQLQELERLVAQATAAVTPPPAVPAPGLAGVRPEWVAEVGRYRAIHDAAALEGGRLLRTLTKQSFQAVGAVGFHRIPVAGGVVTAKAYLPPGEVRGPRPAVLLLHGGAWWMGGGAAGFELNDFLCRELCVGADAVVVNLDYRLAPEHPYPTQRDDVVEAIGWLADDPDGLGVDPNRLALLGISSGGNLSASAARLLRNRSAPPLALQLLLCPSLDMSMTSRATHLDPTLLAGAERLRDMYLQGRVEPEDPAASPALDSAFAGLPPTTIVIGTDDPLRDDGLRYAAGLAAAGIPVTVHEFVMTHTVATPEVAADYAATVVAAARDGLTS